MGKDDFTGGKNERRPVRGAEAEKRAVGGYGILHAVRLGGAEELVGENASAGYNDRYRLFQCRRDNAFGVEEYRVTFSGGDYLKAMREFTRRLNAVLDGLKLDGIYRGTPLTDRALTAGDCVPGGMDSDLKSKAVIIKPESLSPEYRHLSFQLSLATGGFGSNPDARGRAVYCTELYSGEEARWDRSDILGVASDEVLPEWAREKLAALKGEPPRKASVMKQIREAKATPKQPRKAKTPDKSRGEER
jgi:hypothetical protein